MLNDPGALGVWALVIIGAVYFIKEWRENRKLSSEDKLALRDGYAHQVQMLMAENRSLGKDQSELREEYKKYRTACQEETDDLRNQIFALQAMVEETRRENSILKSLLAEYKPDSEITTLLVQLDKA
tara:strand:- start:439 stop:819 length:381 start_codon:yes stop_codon:yes gene_type:complete